MQKTTPTSLTPEQYAQQEYHKQVKPPHNCPNCQRAHSLEALGYYSRFITQTIAAVLVIWIRRFLCRHCRISVSCLPHFAQPYRLVNSQSVEAGFNGQRSRPDVQRWEPLIDAYWGRFEQHLPKLRERVGNAFGAVALETSRPELCGISGGEAAAVWRPSPSNWCSASEPACSALTAASNANLLTLHKGGARGADPPALPPHTIIIGEVASRPETLPRMNQPKNSDALALARHAAVTWIQQAIKEQFSLVRALTLASQRTWGDKTYSASTLESWYYDFRAQGFAALQRKARKALSPEAAQALVAMRRQYPQLKIKVLVRQLIEKGALASGTFSLPSVYRLLAEHGLDCRCLKNNPHLQSVPSGPTTIGHTSNSMLMLMQPPRSVLEKLQLAYDLLADALGQAPQLYDTHLDQALLLLVLAMKRARRSPKLRCPSCPQYRHQDLPF